MEIEFARPDENWPANAEELAERAIRTTLQETAPEITGPFELSIVFASDGEQQALNRQWRGTDSATNVLSFPQIEPFTPLSGLIGDIVLARQTVEREAAEQGKNLDHHLAHLVVHGFLHILGYDHEDESDALAMERIETQILSRLGIPDPYAE